MQKWLKRIGYTLLVFFIFFNVMIAFQAYHFTHFYSNIPKPKSPQEMGVGEKLSAVLFGVKLPKAIVVDSLHIPHKTVTITTEDNLHLEAWYAKRNDSIVPKGTVILFHGHGSSKSGIIKEEEAFYKLGYNILAVDFRAHGNSEGNICTIGYNETKDVKAAYDFITSKGEKNIFLYGISLGAATAIKAMNDYKLKPAKVILEMPFASLIDATKGKLRIMHLPVEPLATLLTFWGGIEQGFWAFNMKPTEYASSINCPVLLQWGIHDTRVTNTETEDIFKHLASHNKLLVEYAKSGHESLLKKEKEKWEKTVADFLMN